MHLKYPYLGVLMDTLLFPDWSKIETEEEMIEAVFRIIEAMGFSAGLFSYTPVGRLTSEDPGLVKMAVPIKLKSEIIDSWLKHHNLKPTLSKEPMSHHFDVFRREMVNRVTPKLFCVRQMLAEGYENRSPPGDRWLKKMLSLGVEQLLSVPHFSARGEYWSLGLFRLPDGGNEKPLSGEQIAILQHLVSNLAQFSTDKLGWRTPGQEKIKRPLTKRELECLYWASKGLTADDTGTELGLNTETVRKYLKNAIQKLGAKNKVAAVSAAHQMGLLGYNI